MKVVFGFLVILLTSCTSQVNHLRIATTVEEPQYELLEMISQTLGNELQLESSFITSNSSSASADSILNNSVDIAIIENFSPFKPGLKTIMPLYEQILHVFYHKDIKASSFKDLCEGRRLYIGEKGSATEMLMQELFKAFEVDTTLVKITDQVFEEVDVFCAFTHVIRKEDLFGMDDFRLFSFDKIEHIGKGSIIDGICIRNPYLSSFVIPNQLYNEINPNPVLTLSAVALLVGSEHLDRSLVYDIVKTIRSSRLQPDREGVIALMDFNDSYNLHDLNFPLHPGAMDYIDRYQPTFLERYAEVMSVIISLAIAFASAFITFKSWSKQRKKNRVDQFYAKILNVKELSDDSENVIDLMQLINEIKSTQKKGFEMLMDEKLIADESFRIFVELSKDTLHSLEMKLASLKEELIGV